MLDFCHDYIKQDRSRNLVICSEPNPTVRKIEFGMKSNGRFLLDFVAKGRSRQCDAHHKRDIIFAVAGALRIALPSSLNNKEIFFRLCKTLNYHVRGMLENQPLSGMSFIYHVSFEMGAWPGFDFSSWTDIRIPDQLLTWAKDFVERPADSNLSDLLAGDGIISLVVSKQHSSKQDLEASILALNLILSELGYSGTSYSPSGVTVHLSNSVDLIPLQQTVEDWLVHYSDAEIEAAGDLNSHPVTLHAIVKLEASLSWATFPDKEQAEEYKAKIGGPVSIRAEARGYKASRQAPELYLISTCAANPEVFRSLFHTRFVGAGDQIFEKAIQGFADTYQWETTTSSLLQLMHRRCEYFRNKFDLGQAYVHPTEYDDPHTEM
eukprot:c18080_g1_i1.p1 GENE.c18080_g1_i1~~c18080_g1_i1.p1  ORF type:complete len:400 (+),score=62.32 c18080_g1_i1:67-1200(+)